MNIGVQHFLYCKVLSQTYKKKSFADQVTLKSFTKSTKQVIFFKTSTIRSILNKNLLIFVV